MRRAVSTALLLALVAGMAGCWGDPCWNVACGERCTLCDRADVTCRQAEQPRYCNADGACVIVVDMAVPLCPAAGR